MLATLIELAAPSVSRAVTLHHPPAGPRIHTSVCPAADGINVLVPTGSKRGRDLPALCLLRKRSRTSWPAAGPATTTGPWIAPGGTLSGDFYVDVYKSSFVGDHNSGCEINMRYKKGPGGSGRPALGSARHDERSSRPQRCGAARPAHLAVHRPVP